MAKFMKIVLIISLSGVIYAAPHAQDTISLSREKRSDCKHPRVSICEVCSGSGKLIRCLNKQNFGEYCYRQYDYTRTGGWKTTMGCTDDATCRANALKSRLANPNCDLDVPPDGTSCYDCCITFLCQELHSDRCNAIYPTNSSTMPDFMQQAVTTRKTHTLRPTTLKPTTPIPTTTTTTPTTTTTAATTTPKPTTTMTTTTTIKTTTTTKMTSTQAQKTTSLETKGTTSKHGGLCQVCSDDGTCSSSHYVYCPENRSYCMNDLIYDKAGRRQTVKRCVSEIYCYWDWWIGTQQNDPKCNVSLSPNVTDDVCHYCCQTGHGDSLPCNVDAIPKQTVSFKKPKKGKLCEVTDLMTNSVQTKECPDSEPFCMNDVFYDKSSASADHVIEVNKKCVSESICKGDWWIKSKARAECLSGDIASVAEGNLLCHYCCLSDDTGPCNNATRPQQIYDFLTKTSIIPSSTGATAMTTSNTYQHLTGITQATASQQTMGGVTKTGTQFGHVPTTIVSSNRLVTGSVSPLSASTMSALPNSNSNTATTKPGAVSTSHVSSISKYPDIKPTSMSISKTSLPKVLSTTTHSHPNADPLQMSASTRLFSSIFTTTQIKQAAASNQMDHTTTNNIAKQTTNVATMKSKTSTSGIPNPKITSNGPNFLNVTQAQSVTSSSQTKLSVSGVSSVLLHGQTSVITKNSTTLTNTTSTPKDQQTTSFMTTPVTPKPIRPISCMLCSGPSFICENRFHSEVCPDASHQYCINDMNNNRDGTRTVERRCATRTDCENDWWRATSDRQECTTYNPQIAYAYVFKCSFCCQGDNCNLKLIPDNLYQGTSHN